MAAMRITPGLGGRKTKRRAVAGGDATGPRILAGPAPGRIEPEVPGTVPRARRKLTRLVRAAAACACALGTAFGAPREPAPQGAEFMLFRDIPVVAASRRREPLSRTPADVTVLTREDVLASGAQNVGELLRRVPGLDVVFRRDQTYDVSFQGLTEQFSNKTLLLLDGKPAVAALRGTTDFLLLPVALQDIQRVESIRGPASALYGSNALAGVINIVTRSARRAGADEAWVRAGTDGNDTQGARATGEAAGGHFKIVAQREGAAGYGTLAALDTLAPVGARNADEFDRAFFRASFEKPLDERTDLELTTAFVRADTGDTLLRAPLGADHRDDLRRFAGTVTRRDGRHKRRLQLLSDRRTRDTDVPASFQVGDLRNSRESGYVDVDLQDQVDHGRSVMTYGLGYRRIDADGDILRLRPPDVVRHSAYAAWDSDLTDRVGLSASALLLRQDDNPVSVGARMAARYHVAEHDTLRLGYGRAFRTPDFLALYFSDITQLRPGVTVAPPIFSGNPSLSDETADTVQASLEHRDSRGRHSLEFYRSDLSSIVTDGIVATGVTVQPAGPRLPLPVTTFVNAPGTIRAQGFILTSERRLTDGLSARAFLARQDLRCPLGSTDVAFSAPARKFGLELRQRVGERGTLDMFFRHVSPYVTEDTAAFGRRRVPGYGVVDLALSVPDDGDRTWTLGVSNLLDRRHIEFAGLTSSTDTGAGAGIALERRLFVECRLEL